MAAIFTRKAGTVIAIPANEDGVSPQAGVVRVEGFDGDIRATGDIIILGFSAPSSVSYKATSTIGGPKYLTVFGDNLMNIAINVMMFQGDGCSAELKGILSGFKFYANNRLRPSATPIVKIAYAGVTFEGFLVGFNPNSQVVNGRQVHTGVFQLIGWINQEWFTSTPSEVAEASNTDVSNVGPDGGFDRGAVRDFLSWTTRIAEEVEPASDVLVDILYGGKRET